MKKMEVGYNIVEKSSTKKKYEVFNNRMSVIQFLRYVKRGIVPTRVTVTGLDEVLYYDAGSLVYEILSNASNLMVVKKPIVQFLVDRIVIDSEPKIKIKGKEIKLRDVFAKTLTQIDVDWFHAMFNI